MSFCFIVEASKSSGSKVTISFINEEKFLVLSALLAVCFRFFIVNFLLFLGLGSLLSRVLWIP